MKKSSTHGDQGLFAIIVLCGFISDLHELQRDIRQQGLTLSWWRLIPCLRGTDADQAVSPISLHSAAS